MDRWKIAQYIALGATIVSVVGICLISILDSDFGWGVLGIGIISGLISYLFGGLGTALKMGINIAKWGWIVVPFPFGFFTFFVTFFIAIIVLVILPIIPVRKAYMQGV